MAALGSSTHAFCIALVVFLSGSWWSFPAALLGALPVFNDSPSLEAWAAKALKDKERGDNKAKNNGVASEDEIGCWGRIVETLMG